jgi:hypothetical protein
MVHNQTNLNRHAFGVAPTHQISLDFRHPLDVVALRFGSFAISPRGVAKGYKKAKFFLSLTRGGT